MADAETFADRLAHACRFHREAPADYGQQAWVRRRLRDLGEDVSSTAVSNWFAGYTQARPALVAKLAQILGVDAAWLATGQRNEAQAGPGAGAQSPAEARPPGAETVDIPVPIRPGLIVHLAGLPIDLSPTEARKLANVVLALAGAKD
jgi:hypothetical protein